MRLEVDFYGKVSSDRSQTVAQARWPEGCAVRGRRARASPVKGLQKTHVIHGLFQPDRPALHLELDRLAIKLEGAVLTLQRSARDDVGSPDSA
jgi:hypothetical protein